jgi:hypothetical protein
VTGGNFGSWIFLSCHSSQTPDSQRVGWIFLSCHSSQTPDSQHVFPLMSTQLMTNPISTLSKSPLYTNPSIHHTDQRPKLINKDLSPRPTPKSRWSTWIRAFVATGGLLKVDAELEDKGNSMTKAAAGESSTAKVRKSDLCDRAWYQTNPLIVADNLVPSDSRITSPFIISAGDQSLYLWSRRVTKAARISWARL